MRVMSVEGFVAVGQHTDTLAHRNSLLAMQGIVVDVYLFINISRHHVCCTIVRRPTASAANALLEQPLAMQDEILFFVV